MVRVRVNKASFTYIDENIKYYKCYINSFPGHKRDSSGVYWGGSKRLHKMSSTFYELT